MKSFKLLLSIFLISISTIAYSQEEEKKLTKEEKRAKRLKNIEFINKVFMIRPAYSLQSNMLQIKDKNGIGNTLNYRPNVWGSAGGQIKLGGLVLSYMYRLPVSEENTKNLGKTDYQNIGLNIQTRYVGLKFDYIDYKGFYLSKPDDKPILPVTDGARTVIPSLEYFSIGFKTTAAFKKDFSINAGFAQTERMKKDAGSFMISIGDRYTKITSDSSFIPISEKEHHLKFFERNFSGLRFNTTYLALGAGYSWVRGYFSFTPIILVGTGVQLQYYNDDRLLAKDNWHLRLPFYFSYRNALSYNHDNFFMRIVWEVELDRSQVKPKGTYLRNSPEEIKYPQTGNNTGLNMFYLNAEISVGFRFIEAKSKEEKKAKRKARKA